MATLPRLSPTAEHRIVRFVCGLPPALLRRVFGAPPTVDGMTLAPDVNALLRLSELAGADTLAAHKPLELTRAETRHDAAVAAGPSPLPMARIDELRVLGRDGEISCRLYVPTGLPQSEPAPLIVYFHGGGWMVGDLDTHDGVCRFLATHGGVAVLAVDYRLAPEHPFPAAVEDAWSAFAWAVANAGAMGVDPARIGVAGDSAGGNLAAVVSVLAREADGPMPALQLLIYPVVETAAELPSRHTYAEGYMLTKPTMDRYEAAYLPTGCDPADPRVAVLRTPDLRGLPPAYLATAGFDPLRDEGEAFAGRLHEAGVPVALRRHPGLIHSYANQTAISPSARAAMLEAAGALRMGLARR